ncbi:hypothetical protein ACFO0N_19380 [Halobium salinum]|uniref:Uncharacterized protein n=1 Tax=Halobium salinum TaxID=1364940 RepID=A0ABD5PHE9_9EURY|nr:hypothetical protein [Halobium salinum]
MSTHIDRKTETTTLETRHYQGARAGVGLTPDEIYVDFALPSPRYFRVRRGDLLMEGDVRGRSRPEMESAHVRKWEVVEVTPDRVVGRTQNTDEREEWERSWVEEQLVRGRLSTDLSDFERVTVVESGDYDPDVDDTGDTSGSPSTVLVALFGDDGKKYLRQYALVESEEREGVKSEDGRVKEGKEDAVGERTPIRLVREDQALLELSGTPRERLSSVVERALACHGYVVADGDGSTADTLPTPDTDRDETRST